MRREEGLGPNTEAPTSPLKEKVLKGYFEGVAK